MPFTGDTFTHGFDWEKDPQRQEKIVNARLESEFDGIDTGLSAVAARATALEGASNAPANAEYIVGATNGTLSAERLVTNTSTVTWDVTVAGQAKANAAVQMSITSDASGLKLSGDEASPGNSEYYGTDSGGTKGYYPLPSALTLAGSWVYSSNVTVVDFTGLSSYAILHVVLIDIALASGSFPMLRTSTDNGSNFHAAGGDYASIAANDATGTTSTAGINLTDASGTSFPYGAVSVFAFNNASYKSTFSGIVSGLHKVGGNRATAEANNALRFTTSGGVNITGGTILVYGQ